MIGEIEAERARAAAAAARTLAAAEMVADEIAAFRSALAGELQAALDRGALVDRLQAAIGKIRRGEQGPVSDLEMNIALGMLLAEHNGSALQQLTAAVDRRRAEGHRLEGEARAQAGLVARLRAALPPTEAPELARAPVGQDEAPAAPVEVDPPYCTCGPTDRGCVACRA